MTKISEKIEEVKALKGTMRKRAASAFFHKTPFFIMFLITFLLTGITELVRTDFNFAVFKSAQYWFNIVLNNCSYLMIAISACLMRADDIITKDETGEITTLTNTLNEISPSLQNTDVDNFIYQTNLERKKKSWLIKIQKRLLKLEMKAKEKDTNDFETYKKTKDKKYHTNYVKKKEKLLIYLSEEYIEKNIEYLDVRYKKITRKLIANGSLFSKDDDLPNKKSVVMMNGILPKFLFSTSIVTFLLCFSFDFTTFSWVGFIFIAMKTIGLIFNFVYGKDFSPTYVKETTIDMLYIRLHWITLYNEWKKNVIGKKDKVEETSVI